MIERRGDELEEGSRLCVSCGLCCRGVLHDYVVLPREELAEAEARGLPVFARRGCSGFDLPCPRLVGTRCSIYAARPSTCRTYRCKLLRRYLAGEMSFGESAQRVEEARALFERLEDRLGRRDPGENLWARLRERYPEAGTSPVPDPETALDIASLQALLRRYFKEPGEGREVKAP